MVRQLIIATSLTATLLACKRENETSASKRSNESDGPPSGSLAIAEVELGVSAVSAQGLFLNSQTQANASAGSSGNLAINPDLALSDQGEFTLGDLSLILDTTDYRIPVLPTYSIGSGAPDALTLYVTQIALSNMSGNSPSSGQWQSPSGSQESGKAPQVAVLFKDPIGKPISILNGAVDLSQLAEKTQNGVATFKVPEGEYNNLKITFRTKATAKGCINARYECRRAQGITPQCADTTPEADIPGSQGLATGVTSKLLTYCTQRDKSLYSASNSQNSDFLGKTPEDMDFPLYMDQGGNWQQEGNTVETNYPLAKAVTILAAETSPRITLLVDMNRMLRYYNRGRVDQGPNPGMPTTKSYFFTSIFPRNTYAFVGAPGKIYGFEMQANACLISTTDSSRQGQVQGNFNSSTQKCSDGNDPRGRVPFWMTIITNASGAPIYALTSPDDDNDLTITKGDVSAFKQCPGNNPVVPWVSPDTGSQPQTATIKFGLCDQQLGRLGPQGAFKYFPANLDGIAVVPPSTAIGGSGSVSGVVIDTKTVEPNSPYYESVFQGPVTVTRRL